MDPDNKVVLSFTRDIYATANHRSHAWICVRGGYGEERSRRPLKKPQEIGHREISMVLGGFPMMNHTGEQGAAVVDSLPSLGVRYCGASHRTGERVMAAFQKRYGDKVLELGVGRRIAFDEDGVLPSDE